MRRITWSAWFGAIAGALLATASVAAAGSRRVFEQVGATKLEVSIKRGRLGLDDRALASSIADSLRAIASYSGPLPVDHVHVAVTPTHGQQINGSTRCGPDGPLVLLSLGPKVDGASMRHDWIVTHELLHVTFTALENELPSYEWVGEGLASYVEPLVRVRAGTLTEAELWHDFLDGAPQGLPAPGDRGLNATHTWGRTYWGGDLFWFEVDLRLRETTAGKKSIRDVLRAVAAAGTNVCVDWPIERLLATGDAATGTHVLADVYAQRALTNAPPELAVWSKRLGVTLRDGQALFDDAAPEAAVRRAMTRD